MSEVEIFGYLKSRLQEIEKNEFDIKRIQSLIDNTEASIEQHGGSPMAGKKDKKTRTVSLIQN